jgi:hypothetical protein
MYIFSPLSSQNVFAPGQSKVESQFFPTRLKVAKESERTEVGHICVCIYMSQWYMLCVGFYSHLKALFIQLKEFYQLPWGLAVISLTFGFTKNDINTVSIWRPALTSQW